MHSHIAYDKPLLSVNTNGQKQDTDECKALLARLPGKYFPSGTPNDEWKRVTKYGSAPMVYRIFENKEGIFAKVVETPFQLAVVGIDIQSDLAKSTPVTKQLEEYLQQPKQEEVKTAVTLESAFDDEDNESMEWLFTHVDEQKHAEYTNTINTMLSQGATYPEVIQAYGEWVAMLAQQQYMPPVDHTHFMFNQFLMLPTTIHEDGSVSIQLHAKNKKIPEGQFFQLPLQAMLQYMSNAQEDQLQWKVSDNGSAFTVGINNTLQRKDGNPVDANYISAYILFKLAEAGLGLADKPVGVAMDDTVLNSVRAAARMSMTMNDAYAAPVVHRDLDDEDDTSLGWSRGFIRNVRELMQEQQNTVPKSVWTNMLHIEDSITEEEIKTFQEQFQAEWEERTEENGEGGSYAFCELLENCRLKDTNDPNAYSDCEYLLRRKAVAGLFTLASMQSSGGESDRDGNVDFDEEDILSGWFEDNTGQIESDEPHWLEYVFGESLGDINESSEISIHGDPTVEDIDGIVTQRIKLYVWAIERGFNVPGAPEEATALVEQRKQMRARERTMQGLGVDIQP